MAPKVYDRYGTEQSWDWLVEHYGPLVIHPANAGPGWRCVELHENADIEAALLDSIHRDSAFQGIGGIQAAAVIMVHAMNADGTPFQGHRVAWYWPDAPNAPDCGPVNGVPEGMTPGRSDRPGMTNENGDVGLAMGGGAYYFPPAIGPHAVWMYGAEVNSDVVFGLGMPGGTNHNSLWPVFQWVEEEEPEPPEPPDDVTNAEILAAVRAEGTMLRADIEALAVKLEGLQGRWSVSS